LKLPMLFEKMRLPPSFITQSAQLDELSTGMISFWRTSRFQAPLNASPSRSTFSQATSRGPVWCCRLVLPSTISQTMHRLTRPHHPESERLSLDGCLVWRG